MLGRTPGEAAPAPGTVETAAPELAITVEQFPGLCLGASVLTSLALNKIGFDALTEKEGQALTDALLKNALAWDLGAAIGNPRAAAALDLAGVLIGVMVPRIVADMTRRAAEKEAQATAPKADALAAAA